MRALTLKRPWHCAILHLDADPKRVENRPWKPWQSVIGQRIALHAGLGWDERAEFDGWDDPRGMQQGIVGTAIVRGWVHRASAPPCGLTHSNTLTHAEAQQHVSSRWFFGPYGWVLEEVRTLPQPIPCSGALGLWALPRVIESQLAAGGFA